MEDLKKYADMSPEEQAAYVAQLELDVKNASDEIVSLSNKLGKAEKSAPKLPSVKVGDEKFKFNLKKFKFEGVVYTASDAAKDKELCAKLIDMGFGGWDKID